jgi:hypothetical protein
MPDNANVLAGGAATPARLKQNPHEATAGGLDVANQNPGIQCMMVARLVQRHGLRPPVAVVLAEAMTGGGR